VTGILRRGLSLLSAAAVALSFIVPGTAQDRPRVEPIEVTSRPIPTFEIGSDKTRFGPFEFVGGLEMTSATADLGALSAFRFRTPGSDFVGVADTGFWFYGTVDRDAQQRPVGVSGFRMVQMTNAKGEPIVQKWEVDAEGLAVRGDEAFVGFERRHRITRFKLEPDYRTSELDQLDFLVPKNELRQNRGFETVTFSPADSPNQGALVVVSEKSLDKTGNIFAAVLSGPHKGIFTVKRSDEFDITDGGFLPGGDLLLLERSFSIATGVGLRLRRIPADKIAGGVVAADGEIVLQANMRFQIDNMEAMDVWTRADGATMVSLMSDDNHSMLQRNLYLEFLLHED
jgi:hypothetical protein